MSARRIVAGFAVGILLTCAGRESLAEPPRERHLSEFVSADDRRPDGRDARADDSEALRKAFASGAGMIRIGAGQYRFSNVTVPENVLLIGAGPSTVIRPQGEGPIFRQAGVSHWAIRDLTLDGGASGDWHQRSDKGQSGVVIEGCWSYELSGLVIRNFNGAGLEISATNLDPAAAAMCNGGTVDRVEARGNYLGIRFDRRAEYIHATRLSCLENVVGCAIHAGNVKLSESNLCSNVDGLVIEDKENGSHGTVANCLLNHNERYALVCRNVAVGMALTGNCFYYGQILIENSTGVHLASGQISCSLTTTGKGVNRISGNYVIPERWQFRLSPQTLVEGNFSANGAWLPGRP